MKKDKNIKPHKPENETKQTDVPVENKQSAPVIHSVQPIMAIGILSIALTILLLIALNKVILSSYNPDINAILDNAFKVSMKEHESFFPEPVERMQYMLSLLCTPVFIFISYLLVNTKKALFYNNKSLSGYINIAGITALLAYFFAVYEQPLVNIPAETTKYFFANNFVTIATPVIALLLYAAFTYFFLRINPIENQSAKLKRIISVAGYSIVGLLLLDIFFYDVFHISMQDVGKRMETNAVFYAVTQVFVGKSLLVNINEQYGLYPWFLNPVFKIIGLSTYKFGIVMAILNVLSFLFFYLGIKKLIKNDILSLLVFLSVAWWFFWVFRVKFEETPRVYYQFHPIRILFPSLTFYLFVLFQGAEAARKKYLLPLLTMAAAIGVLWNMDSGLVNFGATLIALASAAWNEGEMNKIVKTGTKYAGYLLASSLFILALFVFSTKIQSGSFPDFSALTGVQAVFYISGYFMLPMGAMQFWNFPVLAYLAAGVYCLLMLAKKQGWDTPIMVFLFILGAGIFSYFQGRSFDANITAVMYPAIIIAGVFGNKLLNQFPAKIKEIKFGAQHAMFILIFIFLTDSAFSMLYHTPAIHLFSYNNLNNVDQDKEQSLRARMDFIHSNFRERDTVIIIAQDFESYYYASGKYYNPVPITGSTEMFFKSELYTLLDNIKSEKYKIVYDHMYELWLEKDTVVKTIAQHYHIDKQLSDKSMLVFSPGKAERITRLNNDVNTIYYSNIGDLDHLIKKLTLPDEFTIEFYATLDTTKLKKENVIFSNVLGNVPFKGIIMGQIGDTLTNYYFAYGDGQGWSKEAVCRMSCSKENHVVINVKGGFVSVYNNDVLCSQSAALPHIANSDSKFYINVRYSGDVKEMKISH